MRRSILQRGPLVVVAATMVAALTMAQFKASVGPISNWSEPLSYEQDAPREPPPMEETAAPVLQQIQQEATQPIIQHDSSSISSLSSSLADHPNNKSPEQQDSDHYPQKFFAIHIGPSKTGTSAIQNHLRKNPSGETFVKDHLIYVGKRVGQFNNDQDEYGDEKIPRQVKVHNNNSTQTATTTIWVKPNQEKRAYYEAVQCMLKRLTKYQTRHNLTQTALKDVLEQDLEVKSHLRERFLKHCWRYKDRDYSYMLDYSILDSDEAYSYKSKHKQNGLRFFAFDILGYNQLIVVGAYRRYATWLVSAYTEHIKRSCISPSLEHKLKDLPCLDLYAFLRRHLTRRGGNNYRLRQWYEPILVTLPESLEKGPSKLQPKILNYFQMPKTTSNTSSSATVAGFQSYDSITTELYCHALGEDLVPHTCHHALQNAKAASAHQKTTTSTNSTSNTTTSSSSLVANKGSLSDSVYQQIVAAGYRYGYLALNETELLNQPKPQKCTKKREPMWCELLHRCSTKGHCSKQNEKLQAELERIQGNNTKIVSTNSSRIAMFQDLSDYHTRVHQKTWTANLPLQCPPVQMLRELLNKSLKLEKKTLPEFFASPLGKKEHDRQFWNVWLDQKKLFCWVDIPRLFEGATTWKEIIDERMVNYDWGNRSNTRRNSENKYITIET